MDAARADTISLLWGQFYGAVTTNETAAAFQRAVWSVVWVGVNSAITLGTSGVDLKAHEWLNSIDPNGARAHLVGLINSTHQDFISEVPEPSAMLATLSIFGSAGLLFRRRK